MSAETVTPGPSEQETKNDTNHCLQVSVPTTWRYRIVPIACFALCLFICIILFVLAVFANLGFLDVGFSCQCNKYHEGMTLIKSETLRKDIIKARCTYMNPTTNETVNICYNKKASCRNDKDCSQCIKEKVPMDKECQKKQVTLIASILYPIMAIIVLSITMLLLCLGYHIGVMSPGTFKVIWKYFWDIGDTNPSFESMERDRCLENCLSECNFISIFDVENHKPSNEFINDAKRLSQYCEVNAFLPCALSVTTFILLPVLTIFITIIILVMVFNITNIILFLVVPALIVGCFVLLYKSCIWTRCDFFMKTSN